jgi:hypothetical protein
VEVRLGVRATGSGEVREGVIVRSMRGLSDLCGRGVLTVSMYYLAINRDPLPEAVYQTISVGITTSRLPSAAMTAWSPSR